MKYRFVFLCLALALLLTGCRLVPDEYVDYIPHAYTQTSEDENLKVNNYDELKSALLTLIDEGAEESTLTTDVYSGDVERDFNRAVDSITHDYPEEAYLVGAVDREIVSVGSYYRIDLQIDYRHQKSELEGIRDVYYFENLQEYLEAALNASQRMLTLHMCNYVDMDFDKMVVEYCDNNITKAIAKPDRVVKETYPSSGSDRYLVLRFEYPKDDKTLEFRKQFVEYMMDTAKDSVAEEPNELERARKLYAYFMGSGHSYTEESVSMPAYALFFDHKADCRSFSAIYEIMCTDSAVNCITVHGTKDGEPYDWNILELDSGVWHVDVNADAQSGQPELRLLTDADMGGYEWDTASTPACVGFFEPEPPPQEEGEQTEENPEQPAEPAQEPEPGPEPPEEENPDEPEITP